MNIYAIASLLASISCVTLGFFVFLKDKHRLLNRSFTLIAGFAGVWTALPFVISLPEDEHTAVFLARILYMFAAFVPTTFYYFVLVLLSPEKQTREKNILKVLLLLSSIFAMISFHPDFIQGLLRNQPFFTVIPGPLYTPFILFMGLGSGYAFVKCFLGYTHSFGAKRNQLKYILIAFGFAHTGAVIHFLGAYLRTEPFPHDLLLILFAGILSYAIVRHRLMDVTVVMHKGLTYGLLLAAITLPIYLGVLISKRATLYSIPPLLAGSLVLACGLWIFMKNCRTVRNITFGMISVGLSMWLFGFFMIYSSPRAEEARWWGTVVYAGIVYIPAFFYHFCVSFLQSHPRCKLIVPNYLISTIFLLLVPTTYLIDGQYTYFWGYYPKAAILHPVFLIYFGWVSVLSMVKLRVGYKTATAPLEVTRTKYVFWAFAVGYFASLDFIQSYGIEFFPLGYLFVSLWAMSVSYAIAKYQLLDIPFVLTKTKVLPYAEALSIGALSYVVILLLIKVFTGSMHYQLAGILLATNMIFAGILTTLQKHVEGIVGKTFFRGRHEAYETLRQFSKAMVSILDLPTLTQTILTTLEKSLGIRQISLFLLDNEKALYTLSSANTEDSERLKTIRLPAEDGLPYHLRCSQTILVREELEHQSAPRVPRAIIHILQVMGSEVCLPLINKDRLIGFINLGHRNDNYLYTEDDLNLLTSLAQNAAVALDNAILYTDLKRSQLLMQRTDRLRSLETIAGGFAHEIRNPLTSIKTFIQLAPSRKNDEEFIGQFSQVVIEDVYRIERLIQEILDYARYMEPKFNDEDLNDVVSSCLYFIEVKAANKSITIERDLTQDLPRILLDRQQIKQVLLNLFLNAMEAMDKEGGKLLVRTHRLTKLSGDLWVQIEVTDTGSGIAAANLEHIFDPFYTTKHESGEREGTGLGLTIVHQIIQEHHGFIEVESSLGRGTTFYVNLRSNPLLHASPKEHHEHEKAGSLGR
ncbi:MAG TPA: ATP-binding protein [Nitrospiraceae bacterium]|nr:ATP-binding protein [Nitrospiraceae bacterium]